MVVIGHSKGGCTSRLLITDTGEKLWMQVINKSPDQVPRSPENNKLITEALIFKHRPELGRVIFVAGLPQRNVLSHRAGSGFPVAALQWAARKRAAGRKRSRR